MKFNAVLAAGVFALSLATNALAAPETEFSPAVSTFLKADEGDNESIALAVTAFSALNKSHPDPLMQVHLGAATAMQARTTIMPWKKISFAEEGMALQDKALAQLTPAMDTMLQNDVPVSLWVRYVAASTFLTVPDFFHRGEQGRKLIKEVLGSDLLAKSPLDFKGRVWLRAARAAAKDKQLDEARRLYGLIIESKAPQSAKAETELAGLKV